MLTMIVMLGLNAPAGAQDAQQEAPPQAAPKMAPGHESVDARLDRMSKELNLTQEQKDKIRPLLEEQNKQMGELRNNTSLTPEQKRDKARVTMVETREKIVAVLTPEQKQKLVQHMNQMRQQHETHQSEPPPNQ
jgi:Spy/CpxP family protein refolding chaperone